MFGDELNYCNTVIAVDAVAAILGKHVPRSTNIFEFQILHPSKTFFASVHRLAGMIPSTDNGFFAILD